MDKMIGFDPIDKGSSPFETTNGRLAELVDCVRFEIGRPLKDGPWVRILHLPLK